MDTEQELKRLLQAGELDTAERLVESLDFAAMENSNALQLGAALYRRLNKQQQAASFSSQAMQVEPDNRFLVIAHSNDLLKLGQVDSAQAALGRISQAHLQDKHVVLHKCKILYHQKHFKSASRTLVELVQQHPGFAAAHMELAHVLLMRGKWKAGWQEYEWRYRLPKTQAMFPKFRMPPWDGEKDLPHLLLIADQGYGDCFQFCRYIPLAAQRCDRITLVRSEPVARLMNSIDSVTASFTKWEETPLTSAYCTLSGLPRLFSTRPESIPGCSGILKVDKEDAARWKKRIQDTGGAAKLRVGIAWSGRMEFENNYLRAIALESFAPLLKIPEARFFSLQVGEPAAQAKGKAITDLAAELTDFAETAAAMEALDLVITTDTSVAHLAGTLGRPTWVLLNHAPDWRWGSRGKASPWYPSMRLFRQEQAGHWGSVLEECAVLLQEITSADQPRAALASIMPKNGDQEPGPWL